MKDQKKAEEIAAQRMQLLSPLLAEGLDNAQAQQIRARICEKSGISERTLRRYLTHISHPSSDILVSFRCIKSTSN
jgi:putative transposase